MTPIVAIHYDDRAAQRNALILAMAQGFYGSATTMLVATSGLVGAQIAPDPGWATLPQSMWVIGTALTTLPLSLAMKHIGRRNGFLIGAASGLLAALLGLVAIYQRNFMLFLAAMLFMGPFQASSSYYRFAAADAASPSFRPKAISWVMTGGVVAALIGTLLVMKTVDLLAPVTFAGSYATMAVLALACAAVLMALKPMETVQAAELHEAARPLAEIVRQPRYVVAAAVGMMSYGIMVLVMTATPVAMLGCGFHVDDSSWVIQWHVLAMFVPSFFTGSIIARVGAEKVAATGMALLVGAAISGLAGIHFENFAIGLILLGLGWNFGFIGATTILTSTYRPSERNKAQGLNDFLIFGTTALTSVAAGKLLAGVGWNAVNYAVFPMVAIGLAMISWLVTHQRRVPRSHAA
jgi:MFS family permease